MQQAWEMNMAAITTVYFVANRKPDPTTPGGFGSKIIPATDPSQVLYTVAEVGGIVLTQEDSGILRPITGACAQHGQARLVRCGADLLCRW